jgi:hypothetical protein
MGFCNMARGRPGAKVSACRTCCETLVEAGNTERAEVETRGRISIAEVWAALEFPGWTVEEFAGNCAAESERPEGTQTDATSAVPVIIAVPVINVSTDMVRCSRRH